ncbi:fungal-specific transcription factor domain-containing protein [Lipomyces doorenjongii]
MSSSGSPLYPGSVSAQSAHDLSASASVMADGSPPDGDFLPGDSELKRRRIARACDSCRKKKIKCDGKMPSCTNCSNYKTVCVFTYTEKKRNPPKGVKYIESLESRLEKMEDLIRKFVPEYRPESLDDHVDFEGTVIERVRGVGQGASPLSLSNSSSRSNPTQGNRPENHITPADDEDLAKAASVVDETESHLDATDETTSFLITSRDGDSKFIGQSSSFSIFSPRGLRWISERIGDNSFSEQLQSLNDLDCDESRFVALDDNMLINSPSIDPLPKPQGAKAHTTLPLPDMETANQCLEMFASILCPMLPVFTVDEMHRIMNSVYSDKRFRIVDYCAMCAILAIGLRMQTMEFPGFRSIDDTMPPKASPSLQETVEQSWGYFMNAMSYLNELVCGASSITAVQTLLALGLYLDGSDSAEVAYMINANAGRIAQCIGLHSKSSSYGLSEDEVHRRQRIFWICYIIDKDMSLRTGRPPFIYDQDVSTDTPTEINSSYIFSNMIRFSQIQSRTYTRLYSAAASRVSETELLDTIGELDKELLEWRDSMPLQYRPDHEIVEQDPRLLVHLVYMHFAYYNCLTAIHRMSIHHPTWRRPRRGAVTPSSAPRNPRVFASAALCVQAARATIYLLKYFDNVQKSCGWLVVYYTLSSLVTLFANCLQNPQQPSSRSDLALMSTVVKFVSLVSEASHFSSKGERAMGFVEEMVRIATVVVEKSEKEHATKKRPAPDSTPLASTTATATAASTVGSSTTTATNTTTNTAVTAGVRDSGLGTNIGNVFIKPQVVHGVQTYQTQQSPTQFLFGGQTVADDMGVYGTFPSASTVLSPSPNESTQSSYIAQQKIFEPAMHAESTSTPSPVALARPLPASSSVSASTTGPSPSNTNEDSPCNGAALTDPVVLEQMMNFQQPFIPRDIWNLPAVFSWDWGSGTSAAALSTEAMPPDASVTDGGINIGASTVPEGI